MLKSMNFPEKSSRHYFLRYVTVSAVCFQKIIFHNVVKTFEDLSSRSILNLFLKSRIKPGLKLPRSGKNSFEEMSATVRSGFKEQTSRLQEIGKVIFKWTIQDFHKFQDIEGEIR